MRGKTRTITLFSLILVIQFIGLFFEIPGKGIVIFSLSVLFYFLAVLSIRTWHSNDEDGNKMN